MIDLTDTYYNVIDKTEQLLRTRGMIAAERRRRLDQVRVLEAITQVVQEMAEVLPPSQLPGLIREDSPTAEAVSPLVGSTPPTAYPWPADALYLRRDHGIFAYTLNGERYTRSPIPENADMVSVRLEQLRMWTRSRHLFGRGRGPVVFDPLTQYIYSVPGVSLTLHYIKQPDDYRFETLADGEFTKPTFESGNEPVTLPLADTQRDMVLRRVVQRLLSDAGLVEPAPEPTSETET